MRRQRLELALLIAGVVLLVFGTNLQGVLLPIRGHERGASMVAIGLFSSGWSAGFVLSCLVSGRLAALLGASRAYAALAIAAGFAAAGFAFVPRDDVWIALRFASGFCFGGGSVIVEGWILSGAARGSRFALYMMANLCASICGTLSLNAIDPTGPAPFLLAAGTLGLSALPVALASRGAPVRTTEDGSRPRLLLLIGSSPEAAAGCLLAGAVTGALGGLAPLFGAMQGLGMTGTTLMLAANSIGGAIAYAPLARFSERIDRTVLCGALAAAGVAVSATIVLVPHAIGPFGFVLLLGAMGVVQYPIYGLSVGRASEEAPTRSSTAVASEALLLFGTGTIVGPVLGAAVMRTGAQNLFLFVGSVFAVLLAVSLSAWRPGPPGERLLPTTIPGYPETNDFKG